METRVRIAEPFGTNFVTVPHFLSANVVWPFRDRSVLNLHYPLAGAKSELLGGECEAVFEYWNGTTWVEPLDSRFKVLGRSGDSLEATPTLRYDFTALLPSMLDKAYVWEAAGLTTDADGNILFAAVSPGRILRTLFLNAQARGWGTSLSVDFGDSTDSDGQAWASVINLTVSPTQSLYEILAALGDQGVVDWAGQGRILRVFNPDSYLGRDLPGVRLLAAQGETSAPIDVSYADRATTLRVVGENGAKWDRANGLSPWGRLESIVTAGGVADEGTAYLLSDEELLKSSGARISRTREFNGLSKYMPHRDYRGGDHVRYQTENGVESMRVFSVSLTVDDDVTGYAVLGDRFEDALVKAARKQTSLVIGNANGGNGQQPSTSGDTRTPENPLGFIAMSSAYLDNDGAESGLIAMSWTHTGKATDGTAMDLDRFEFRIRASAPGEKWRSFLGVAGADRTATLSPVDTRREDGEPALYDLAIRAVGANSRVSAWVYYNELLMATDTTPPPVPSALVMEPIQYAAARARWDGFGASGELMPPDFDYSSAEVGGSPTGPWTLFGTYAGGSVQSVPFDLAYGTYWLRHRTFDRAGNASAYSALTEFELKPSVALPDIDEKISQLEQGISDVHESANGKNTIFRQTYPPNVDGNTVGDVWWQYTFANRLIGQWMWDGTEWQPQTMDYMMLARVDLGVATVGFLHGSRIEVGTLSVNTLIAGDFTNLARLDPNFGMNVTKPESCLTEGVDGWTRKAAGGDNILLFTDQIGPVPLESGDEIHVSFRGMADQPVTVSCSLWVYPGTETPFGAVSVSEMGLEFGSPQDYSFSMTVPDLSSIDGGRSWTVGLSGAGIRAIAVQNVRVYKKTGAVLIKDGAVHAEHIFAGEIESYHVKANSIEGDRMAAGFADFIVMTGSLVQTEATANRGIKIDAGTNSMRGWNVTGDQVFYLNANNGDLFLGKGSPIRLYGATGNVDIGSGRLTVDGSTGHMQINMGNEGTHAIRLLGDDGRSMQLGADANGGYIGFSVPAFFAAGVLRLEETNNAITLRSPREVSGDEAGYFRMFPGKEPGVGAAPITNTNAKLTFTRSDSGIDFVNGAVINGQQVMRITAGASIYVAAQGLDASNSTNSDLQIYTDEVGRYVRSYTVYNREYSASSNLYITASGFIGRTTSKSANKLDQQLLDINDDVLNVPLKTWFDRSESIERQELAELGVRNRMQQSIMEQPQRRIPGMIAEEVAKVAPEFVTYSPSGEIQGFDRDILALAQIQALARKVRALEELLEKR